MAVQSPLNGLHQELGAKFTDFAGFQMPLQFTSIKDEHLTVRKTIGVFDVSHMSNVWITGKQAEELVSYTTVEDASKIPDKKSQYTAILRENGTIIDDTIFMHLDDKFMMIPNAGMATIVTDWLNTQAEKHDICAQAENVSSQYAILAVQGPKSREILQQLTETDLNEVKFFGCQYATVADVDCIISHTGYTGELGFELNIRPGDQGIQVFKAILEAGKNHGIKPIGLGARDTLRLEKGFLLAGNEFEGGRTPLEAVMSWAINWDHEFIGKEALLKQKEQGDYERLTSFICKDKGIPRHGNTVEHDGESVGFITSGTLSPCLNKGIAMGYVQPDHRDKGTMLDILIRGKPVKAEVVRPPIVPKDWAQQANV